MVRVDANPEPKKIDFEPDPTFYWHPEKWTGFNLSVEEEKKGTEFYSKKKPLPVVLFPHQMIPEK